MIMNYTAQDHTFVICAYKENPELEVCVQSLKAQTVKSKIIISTSTPNEHIANLAEKYDLELYINTEKKGVVADWNFAYGKADTQLITLAHQDDIYNAEYLENVISYANKCVHPLIIFTASYELRNGQSVYKNKILKIKALMSSPLKISWCQSSKFIRRRILSMGCPICCPAVTFVRNNVFMPPFQTSLSASPDWETWEKISQLDGQFVYCSKQLMAHRISDLSITTLSCADNVRSNDEMYMLCKFWPKPIAKFIFYFYSKAQNSNNL